MRQAAPERIYFQDGLHGNHCFGCGAWNRKGLNIKSYWDGDPGLAASGGTESVCVFTPQPHQSAMPPDIMNGGILAALIDCHSVCTAIAEAYEREDRSVGEGDKIWYATASLLVNYRKPTPLEGDVTVRSRITAVRDKKTWLEARLFAHNGEITCDGEVLAVRVPDEWADPAGLLPHIR